MPLAVPDWESLERSSAGLSGQVPPGSRDDDYYSTDHLLPLVPGREPHPASACQHVRGTSAAAAATLARLAPTQPHRYVAPRTPGT